MFCDTMLRMCTEWSLGNHSLLRSTRTEALQGQFGLKLRTEGYSWFRHNKQDRNYIKITRTGEYKTLLHDVDALWVVPSSNTKQDQFKVFAKKRFALREKPSIAKDFDEFVMIRSSCWVIEEKGGQFYCDCYNGIKGKLCKHSVGLLYKTKGLTETEDVRSQPLGQKRMRGRPKKLPHCLASSPAPVPINTEDPPPVASYHQPSPEILGLSPPRPSQPSSPEQGTAETSPELRPLSSSPNFQLSPHLPSSPLCSPVPSSHVTSILQIPAATRKSRKRKCSPEKQQRKKVFLNFVEFSESQILTIPSNRTLRRRK